MVHLLLDFDGLGLGFGGQAVELALVVDPVQLILGGAPRGDGLGRLQLNLQGLLAAVAHDAERDLFALVLGQGLAQVAHVGNGLVLDAHDDVARLQARLGGGAAGHHFAHQHTLALLHSEVFGQLRRQLIGGNPQPRSPGEHVNLRDLDARHLEARYFDARHADLRAAETRAFFERHLHRARLPAAADLERHLAPGGGLLHQPPQLRGAAHPLAGEGQDDVVLLQPGLGRRGVLFHLFNHDAGFARELQLRQALGGDVADAHPQPGVPGEDHHLVLRLGLDRHPAKRGQHGYQQDPERDQPPTLSLLVHGFLLSSRNCSRSL